MRVHVGMDVGCAGAALLAAPLVPQGVSAATIKKENLSGFQRADQRSAFQVFTHLQMQSRRI